MEKLLDKIPLANAVLKGVGQIMLQENSYTGLLFLAGLFIGGWQYGAAALLAALIGTITAKLLQYSNSETNAGLYGFSPALVGVALVFLFEASPLVWLIIVGGSAFAAVLQHFFIVRKIPVYTFPFIAITWLLVWLLHNAAFAPAQNSLPFETPLDNTYLLMVLNGYGEVIFQVGLIPSLLFFIAVFIGNKIAAFYGLAASLLGALLSLAWGQDIETVQAGLFGFNAVLTALVFAGNTKQHALWVVVGVLITIALNNLLVYWNVFTIVGGVFTFPFVTGTWITLLLKQQISSSK